MMLLFKNIILFIGIFLISACCSQKKIGTYDVRNNSWGKASAVFTLYFKCNGKYKSVLGSHPFGRKNHIVRGKWKIDGDTLMLQNKEYSLNLLVDDSTTYLYKFTINEGGKLELTEDSYFYPQTRKRLFKRYKR